MRKLKVKDIAPAVKVAKSLKCGEQVKEIASKTTDASKAGVEIIGLILSKYAENEKAQALLAEFFAGPFEMTAADVMELDIDVFVENIKAIGGIQALSNFFGSALA